MSNIIHEDPNGYFTKIRLPSGCTATLYTKKGLTAALNGWEGPPDAAYSLKDIAAAIQGPGYYELNLTERGELK